MVFTDDDCQPEADWLGRLSRLLTPIKERASPSGRSCRRRATRDFGFIVGYIPPRRQRLTGRLAKRFDGGIGANMALRRSALIATGGFDELLGAGGYFRAVKTATWPSGCCAPDSPCCTSPTPV
jgi:hypothetical protein